MGGVTGTGSELVIALMLASGGVPGQQAAPPPAAADQTPSATPSPAVIPAPAPSTREDVAVAQPDASAATAALAPMPRRHAKGDPLEGFNRTMYGLHTRLDRAIFRPVAFGYKTVVPKPVRGGLRHLFANLTEPIVFLNDLLQLKPKRAIKTFARFLINSTAGIGGLLDLAKDDGLPHRDNGFGNTLARYGLGPGPYLFLPFFGPSTLRDFAGGQADGFVLPVAIGKPFNRLDFQIARGALDGLDLRVESDDQLKALLSGAADPYATLRSVHLQNRVVEVNELLDRPPPSPLEDMLADPLADPEAKPDDGKAPPTADPKPDTDKLTGDAATAEPAPKDATLAFVAYSDWRI